MPLTATVATGRAVVRRLCASAFALLTPRFSLNTMPGVVPAFPVRSREPVADRNNETKVTMRTIAKIPASIRYEFDPVTIAATRRLCATSAGTVSEQSHLIGMEGGEPLIIMLDCLAVYAKAHKARFFSKLSDDGVLGDEWLAAAKGVRGLLNGDGAVAHFTGRTTDSKDNGTLEAMFWAAMDIAGFTEADL